MEGIKLPAALTLLLGADLVGARKRPFERGFEVGLAGGLAADVADDAPEPSAQDAQLSAVAVELLGVGIAPGHHGGPLGDAPIGLPQLHAVLVGQAVEPPDRGVQELAVGGEGDGLGLHRGIDRDPFEVLGPERAGLVRHPQALGQEKLELVAEPLAPMAEIGALVREGVLEKLLPGEAWGQQVVIPLSLWPWRAVSKPWPETSPREKVSCCARNAYLRAIRARGLRQQECRSSLSGKTNTRTAQNGARRAHAQNPRFTGALRLLTTHLAYLGQVEEAQETLAKLLSIEPDLTISKFRSRRRFIAEGLFQKLSEGWRRAGLPL